MTGDALLWHRMQFAFTVTYHYLFPQLTMGLALLIVLFKIAALRTGNERYSEVASWSAYQRVTSRSEISHSRSAFDGSSE